ncbi:MAG: hypothetical protein ACFFB3_01300 [Candidatus Hodarchaeota archaeon]
MGRKRCPICHRNVNTERLESHFALRHPEAVDFFPSQAEGLANKEIGPEANLVVVDGPNILHLKARGNILPMKLLFRVLNLLKRRGYDPVVVFSARTKYQIDDQEAYVAMWKAGEIIESPAGEDDDLFILETARRLKASWIVSNDNFVEYSTDFPGIADKRMRCAIRADGRIHLAKVR